jgi:hypothetical protein
MATIKQAVEKALQDLAEYEKLKPGWDYEGAESLRPEAVKGVKLILAEMLGSEVLRKYEVSEIDLGPCQDGTIDLEFGSPRYEVLVNVKSETHFQYLLQKVIKQTEDRAVATHASDLLGVLVIPYY